MGTREFCPYCFAEEQHDLYEPPYEHSYPPSQPELTPREKLFYRCGLVLGIVVFFVAIIGHSLTK
jgi:hypothetical protein